MPGFVTGKKRCAIAAPSCFSDSSRPSTAKRNTFDAPADNLSSILPGLSDDVAKVCLALVPRSDLPSAAAVCKRWRSFIGSSREFQVTRKLAGVVEEWIYLLVADEEGKERHWEVLDRVGNERRRPPPMPGPVKASFGAVALDGKLFIVGGCSVANGTRSASADVYQYDSCLNSWRKLASMNTARYDFACAEVNGMIYAAGGYGTEGESLSSAEFYSPETDKWTVTEPLRRPRTGSFGFGFEKKLYVMGGRSSFTIGNSRSVDIYDTDANGWREMKKGCVMVTSHSAIGRKLYCLAWKDPRKLAVFDPGDGSWKSVPIPLTGSSSIGFMLGILGGKLLLFSQKKAPWYTTLVYDPEATPGSEWQTRKIRPSGGCLMSLTIEA